MREVTKEVLKKVDDKDVGNSGSNCHDCIGLTISVDSENKKIKRKEQEQNKNTSTHIPTSCS